MSDQASRRGAGRRENNNNVKFWEMSNGRFRRRVKEGDLEFDTATERELTKGANIGTVVREVTKKDLTGELLRLETKHHDEFGSYLLIFINVGIDTPEVHRVAVKFGSSYADSFMRSLPNVDFDNDINLDAWTMPRKDDPKKNKVGLTVSQWNDDSGRYEKVSWYYTREQPNGLPELKVVMLDGKKRWDSTERWEFLASDTAINDINSELPGMPNEEAQPTKSTSSEAMENFDREKGDNTTESGQTDGGPIDETDDLPF